MNILANFNNSKILQQLFALGRAINNQVVRNASVEAGPRTARLKELQKRLQVLHFNIKRHLHKLNVKGLS
ncbi:unnamed protein product [Diabrotica balteata]|uniref:Uncharacterized protein n=1 Tax=Diabrotica balteata TaxID=107213 RepID=A0A9N9TAV8_DIABA|nr:unnamed protein product [Diabrotica balteata]